MAIRITDGRGENSRAASQGRLTAARRAHTVRPYAPICALLLVRLRIGRTAGATTPAASGRPGPAYGRTVGRAASQGRLTAARRAHAMRPYAPICTLLCHDAAAARRAASLRFRTQTLGLSALLGLCSSLRSIRAAPHAYTLLRCRTASYSSTAAAAEALSELIFPNMGMETVKSQVSATRRLMPDPSLPMTMAAGPFRSAS